MRGVDRTTVWLRFAVNAALGKLASAAASRAGMWHATLVSVLLLTAQADAQWTVAQLLQGSVANPSDPQYAALQEAIDRFGRGDIDGARRVLDKVAESRSDLPPTGVLLAKMLLAASQPDSARAELELVVSQRPGDPEPFVLLGREAMREGRWIEAEALYDRARRLLAAGSLPDARRRPLQITTLAGLTTIATTRQQWTVAESLARQWLEVDPRSAAAHLQLGQALFFQRQFRSAYEAFQQAAGMDESLPQPEVQMGLLYEQLAQQGDASKHDSARNAMLAAIRDPNNLATRLAVARWGLTSCELQLARASAEAAVQLSPENAEAQLLRGLVARHERKWDEAERALKAAHLAAPADPAILAHLTLVLAQQSDADKLRQALAYADLNMRLHSDYRQPVGREAGVVLAWTLHRFGQTRDALATVRGLLQHGSLSPEGSFLAAQIAAAGGDRQLALQLLQTAIQQSSCFPTRDDAKQLLRELQSPDEQPKPESERGTPR